ncbi:hypothetical protein TNCV_1471441 [Trichonephila clavipes]|nr:hypothetical protein TNCV_1471441 [Trichonephila clavipes]
MHVKSVEAQRYPVGHKTSERSHFVNGKRHPPSSLIGAGNRFARHSPHCSTTPPVSGDNKLEHLIPTTKRHLVHHLEAINCIVTFPLRMCFYPDRPTLFYIQVVCVPDVQRKPKQLMLFHEASFLQSLLSNDRLYVGKINDVVLSNPFSKTVNISYALGIRKE